MKSRRTQPDPTPEDGGPIGGFLSGLAGLVNKLNELAKTGEELRRTGEFRTSSKGVKGVYGFTVKAGLGDEAPHIEPFGNIGTDKASGKAVVQEIREPPVDVFKEKDFVLVVAEMPGIGADDVHLDVKDDVLTLSAARGDKKYRREILLPACFPREKMQVACNNGVVEIRCFP